MTQSNFTQEYNAVRMRLVEARKQAQLTQVDLAKKLNRPQSFVSKYERGERRLDVVEFLQVVRALGGDPHQIIDDLEVPASHPGRRR